MTETAERYRRLAGLFTEKVAAVSVDQWANPSPCEEWTARDVVNHVIETTGLFFGLVGAEPPQLPSGEVDELSEWVAARDAMQAALADPQMANREYDGALGRQTLAEGVDRFICVDLVIHNWDLSRATGQDERIDPDEIHRVYEALKPMDDMMRAPGAFGLKIEPSPDADQQTKLLNFLGRQV